MAIRLINFGSGFHNFYIELGRATYSLFVRLERFFSSREPKSVDSLRDKEIDLEKPVDMPKAQEVFFVNKDINPGLLAKHNLLIKLQKKYEAAILKENANWIQDPLNLELLDFFGFDIEKFLDHELINKQMHEFMLNMNEHELNKLLALSDAKFDEFIISQATNLRYAAAGINDADRLYMKRILSICDEFKSVLEKEIPYKKDNKYIYHEFIKAQTYQFLTSLITDHKETILNKILFNEEEKSGFFEKGLNETINVVGKKSYFMVYFYYNFHLHAHIWECYYKNKNKVPFEQIKELARLKVVSPPGACYALSMRQSMSAYHHPSLPLENRGADMLLQQDIEIQNEVMKQKLSLDDYRCKFLDRNLEEKILFEIPPLKDAKLQKQKLHILLRMVEGNFLITVLHPLYAHAMFLRLDSKTKNYYFFEPNKGTFVFKSKTQAIECCLKTCQLFYPNSCIKINQFQAIDPYIYV